MRQSSLRRGGVLVITLAVLAGLVAIVAATAAGLNLSFRSKINRLDQQRAELVAYSGLQYALSAFQRQDANAVTALDEWAELGSYGDDNYRVGRGTFRVMILDASSRVNLNSASQEQLELLPMTPEQIESLLDWRETEFQPRPQGAKDQYYNTLSNPYNARLGRLETLDELLLIRGFTPGSLYEIQDASVVGTATFTQGASDQQPVLADLVTVESFSQNVSPTGEPKLNVNTATAAAMMARGLTFIAANAIVQRRNQAGTFTTMGQVVTTPGVGQDAVGVIMDNLTVGVETRVEGRININTASEAVLNTVPNLPPDVASAIVARQTAGFSGIGELMTIPGFTQQLMAETADLWTTSSETFIVRVVGLAGRAEVALEAVIRLEEGAARLIKIRKMPFNNMTTRWGWADQPVNEIVLGDEA
jgi:DNA uptake protein ComE-like DNA-binding protein